MKITIELDVTKEELQQLVKWFVIVARTFLKTQIKLNSMIQDDDVKIANKELMAIIEPTAKLQEKLQNKLWEVEKHGGD